MPLPLPFAGSPPISNNSAEQYWPAGNGYSWAHSVEATATCAMPPNTITHTNGSAIDTTSGNASEWGTYHGFKSKHPGGVNFVYADGTVHFVANNVACSGPTVPWPATTAAKAADHR